MMVKLIVGIWKWDHFDISKSCYNLRIYIGLQPAQVAPFDWSHANLDDFRVFLRNEIATGRFVPLQDLPL